MEGEARPVITVKIPVVAFFYEKGKSGNDFTHKELYKLPIPVGGTGLNTLKEFSRYAR